MPATGHRETELKREAAHTRAWMKARRHEREGRAQEEAWAFDSQVKYGA